jgi:hypothetical protein
MRETGLSAALSTAHQVVSSVAAAEFAGTELRELLVTLERLGNAVAGAQATVMMQMRHEAEQDDIADSVTTPTVVPTGMREEFVVDEIAVELHCSRVAASMRLADAMTAHEFEAVGDAWRHGRIDARKVRVIGQRLFGVDPVFVGTLTEGAIAYGGTHTVSQLAAWLDRRVVKVDPESAQKRCEQATEGRQVVIRPLPDGVAEISARMPAVQARHLYDTVNAAAHGARSDDGRTIDQLRSDALYDLVTGRAEPPQVHLNITVPAAVIAGTGSEPAELSGYGPMTSAQARDLIGEAPGTRHQQIWRRLVTDPVTGVLTDISEKRYRPSATLDRAVRARDVTCRFPGCRRSALTVRNGVDLDHTVPWSAGKTEAANLACLCRHHHRLKHSPGWHASLAQDGTMKWTTPAGRTFFTAPWSYHDPPAEGEVITTEPEPGAPPHGPAHNGPDHNGPAPPEGDDQAPPDDEHGAEATDAA